MGKLIAIEGLDASGKATQSAILADRLTKEGKKVRLISFPDYDSEGSLLVRRYLGGTFGSSPDDTNAYAASMFFAADRFYSYKTGWMADYLDPDTVIIANRYTTANAYHQLSKLPEDQWDGFLSWLWDFEFTKLGLPAPDHVLCLEMPPEVSTKLLAGRCDETGAKKDIHEADTEYLEKCYKAALYVSEKSGWSLISCSDNGDILPREVIAERINRAVAHLV